MGVAFSQAQKTVLSKRRDHLNFEKTWPTLKSKPKGKSPPTQRPRFFRMETISRRFLMALTSKRMRPRRHRLLLLGKGTLKKMQRSFRLLPREKLGKKSRLFPTSPNSG